MDIENQFLSLRFHDYSYITKTKDFQMPESTYGLRKSLIGSLSILIASLVISEVQKSLGYPISIIFTVFVFILTVEELENMNFWGIGYLAMWLLGSLMFGIVFTFDWLSILSIVGGLIYITLKIYENTYH